MIEPRRLCLVALLATMGCPTPDEVPVDAPRPDALREDAFVARPDVTATVPDAALEDAFIPPGVDAPRPDAFVRTCPPIADRPVTRVRGEIRSDTFWDCAHTWLIEADGDQGPLYVTNRAVLTIEAGTVVRGAVRNGERRCVMETTRTCVADGECAMSGDRCGTPAQQGTALVVTRGSRLEALGTQSAPVVFTSDNLGNVAAPPRAGDWGGLVLLGDAPTNWDPPDAAQIEGLPSGEGRGVFGGANAAGSCGTLRYVRVEYAGYIVGRNNELNGITLGGCGAGTLLDHVQVHLGLDDGIEFFGGAANARAIVVTGTGDDSLDFDLGWTGHAQFVIAQQRDVAGEDRCIEGDNHPNNYARTPISRPTLYNLTCIGAGTPGTDAMDGMILRRGGQAIVRNSIFVNLPDRGFQAQDLADSSGVTAGADTLAALRGATPTTRFEGNILFRVGAEPARNRFFSFQAGSMAATDAAALTAALEGLNDDGIDPAMSPLATDFLDPNFAPLDGPAATGALPTPEGAFWQPAPYRGAVRPGGTGSDLWYLGWTRFTP